MAAFPVEFRPTRLRLTAYLVGAILFVALGVLLVSRPGMKASAIAAGWACILFFGLGAVMLVLEFVQPRLFIRLDERGIDFRSGLATPRVVLPWSAILSVRQEAFMSATFVHLDLRDPNFGIEEQGAAKAVRRTNEALTGSGVPIDPRIFGVKPETLVSEIDTRLKEYGDGQLSAES